MRATRPSRAINYARNEGGTGNGPSACRRKGIW
jgi:hypothetical protein